MELAARQSKRLHCTQMSVNERREGSSPRESADDPRSDAQGERGLRAIEALFQEIVRRGASLGFASFFLTEEAIRRAFADRVPPEWIEYLSRQSAEMRGDVVERVGQEFGSWLGGLDLSQLLRELFERYELRARVELVPRRAEAEDGTEVSLKIVRRSE